MNSSDWNLAQLQMFVEKAAGGANASRLALTQIKELPEIELLAEQLNFPGPANFPWPQ